MSQLEKLLKDLDYSKSLEEAKEVIKIAVTARIEEQHIFKLDFLAKHFGLSRTAMSQELLISACMDAMTELGYDDQQQFDMWLETLNIKEEVK